MPNHFENELNLIGNTFDKPRLISLCDQLLNTLQKEPENRSKEVYLQLLATVSYLLHTIPGDEEGNYDEGDYCKESLVLLGKIVSQNQANKEILIKAYHEKIFCYSELRFYPNEIQAWQEVLALELSDDVEYVNTSIAALYLKMNNFAEAIEYAKKALQIKPDRTEPKIILAYALLKSANDKIQLDEAEQFFLKIRQDSAVVGSEKTSSQFERMLSKSHSELASQRNIVASRKVYEASMAGRTTDQIILLCSEALAIDPAHAKAHQLKGSTLAKKGSKGQSSELFNEAMCHLNEAVKLQNRTGNRVELVKALRARGFGAYQFGKWKSEQGDATAATTYQKAEDDFSEILRHEKDDPDALYLRGKTRVRSQKMEEGVLDLQKAHKFGRELLSQDMQLMIDFYNSRRGQLDSPAKEIDNSMNVMFLLISLESLVAKQNGLSVHEFETSAHNAIQENLQKNAKKRASSDDAEKEGDPLAKKRDYGDAHEIQDQPDPQGPRP